MPYLPAKRTTRRLLKVASLGLAGLIAGLLSGCTSSSNASPHYSSNSTYSSTYSSSYDSSTGDFSQLPQSLDARQIPSLRHPPSARRLYYGSVPNSHPQLLPVMHTHS